MYFNKSLSIALLISFLVGIGCHEITNSSNPNEINQTETETKKSDSILGPEFIKIKGKSTAGLDIYKSSDGRFAYVEQAIINTRSLAKTTGYESADFTETFRYEENSNTFYSSNHYNFEIGLVEGYSSSYQNETFRQSASYEDFINAIPNGSYIEEVGMLFDMNDPSSETGNPLTGRTGYIQVRTFPYNNTLGSGDEEHFDEIGNGTLYFESDLSLNYNNNESFTSGSFYGDVKYAFDNSENGFAVGLKAKREDSNGLSAEFARADLVIISVSPPSSPNLSAPGNDALADLPVIFSWEEPSEGADTYTLQIDDQSDFSSPVYNQSGITSTSKSVSSLSRNTKYYWRIKATNKAATSNWSNSRSVTIRPEKVTSITRSVSNGHPVLDWDSSDGAASYDIYYRYGSETEWEFRGNITSTYFYDSSVHAPTMQVGGPTYNYENTYSYKIVAQSSSGIHSVSSNIQYFIRDDEDCTGPGCAQ